MFPEHVWDLSGRRLPNLPHFPQKLEALGNEEQIAWDTVLQDNISHVSESMSRRLNECVANRGV